MTQVTKSQGQEGGLAPADPLAFKQSGGKPTFLTLSLMNLTLTWRLEGCLKA